VKVVSQIWLQNQVQHWRQGKTKYYILQLNEFGFANERGWPKKLNQEPLCV